MKHFSKLASSALLACITGLTFAGCGGGGGDSPTPTPTGNDDNSQSTASTRSAAAGFWGGPFIIGSPPESSYNNIQTILWDTPAANGFYIGLVILPTGETWIINTTDGIISGAQHGKTQATDADVTIDTTYFDSTSLDGSRSRYSGSVVPKSQFHLVPIVSGNGRLPAMNIFTTYDAHYDQTATLAQLAGAYTGNGSNGSGTYYSLPGSTAASGARPAALSPLSTGSYTITISSSGAVTLPPDPLGCSGSGTATPRTDSNVFDLGIRFSGSKCVLGDGVAVKGIAVVESGHLLMMAIPLANSNPSGEFVYMSN